MTLAPPRIRVSHPRPHPRPQPRPRPRPHPHPRPRPHLGVGEEHDRDDLVDDQVVDLLAQVRDPLLVQPALTPHLCAKQGSEPSVTCTRRRTTARCLSRGVCLCPRQITLQATGRLGQPRTTCRLGRAGLPPWLSTWLPDPFLLRRLGHLVRHHAHGATAGARVPRHAGACRRPDEAGAGDRRRACEHERPEEPSRPHGEHAAGDLRGDNPRGVFSGLCAHLMEPR